VQPVYLQATGTGGAPTELQFVIVATNLEVEMRPTLEEALVAVAGDDAAAPADAATANVEGEPTPGEDAPAPTIADALIAFDRGERALQDGDWAAYGEAQEELGRILDALAPADGVEAPQDLESAQPAEPVLVGTPVPNP
jgi:uncharacterized protein